MKTTTIVNFSDDLAAKKPTPGGGGVAALAGSLGAALGQMVINYTTGKKKFIQYEDDLEQLMVALQDLRVDLLDLIQKDAEMFEPLSRAYSLPKSTEEEIKIKDEIMEKALSDAAMVPYQIAKLSLRTIEILEKLVPITSKMVISDIAVGVECASAALKSAAVNVKINTKSMKNRQKADTLDLEITLLVDKGVPIAENVYQQVFSKL